MTYKEFSTTLKELGLSKEEFSAMVGMNYNSVANWNQKGIPAWVDAFLFQYKKAKELDIILEILKKYEKT